MLDSSTTFLAPSEQFWSESARHLISMMQSGNVFNHQKVASISPADFSAIRVIVPAFEHARLLTMAMSEQLDDHFIPPRINTMNAWLAMQMPTTHLPIPEGERLMSLYAQLREHAWLKKLFSARKNTDLLPLAQTLITLSDELTQAMLPLVFCDGMAHVEHIWHQALAAMSAQQVLSDEAHMVWQIWTSQLDGQDAISLRFQQMLSLAGSSNDPLLWISPVAPEGLDQLFLNAYAKNKPVQVVTLDWRATGLRNLLGTAWPEIVDNSDGHILKTDRNLDHVSTIAANNLEQEAQLAAQTIVDWLHQGKSRLAIIAQDRVAARRIRALLERAQVFVADETGWKLSTTRAASALAAWFDVIATRADTLVVLDFLKSPYFDPISMRGYNDWVMTIEIALLRANAVGGWDAMIQVLEDTSPECAALIKQLKSAATRYSERKNLSEWSQVTRETLGEFGLLATWQQDVAGQQVEQLLSRLMEDCKNLSTSFSFSEWRVFINLQLEDTSFHQKKTDQRVAMLPLNGARLRSFDAVLVVGCDASHLPSQPKETLFFTNTVRRECGLITREQRHRQQLRDFAELLSANPEVVLSWQTEQNGESNSVSPWIERLNLCLRRSGQKALATRVVQLTTATLPIITTPQPKPAAPHLRPTTLSASGYNSFLACPYQFFATRMLGLAPLDTLSDMPEKRDYGGWLHAILKTYHEQLKAHSYPKDKQEALLRDISEAMFDDILQRSPAALGYKTRWEKVIPGYVTWSQERIDAGWQYEFGEVWLEKTLTWADGKITLRGQIDRIDKNHDGQFAVLDYKTNPVSALKKKLKGAEDQQLPFYGLLSEQTILSAHYVPLELSYEEIADVAAENYSIWQNKLKESIIQNMTAIGQGAELPAQGVSQVCQYCDVRGLCRKGAW